MLRAGPVARHAIADVVIASGHTRLGNKLQTAALDRTRYFSRGGPGNGCEMLYIDSRPLPRMWLWT